MKSLIALRLEKLQQEMNNILKEREVYKEAINSLEIRIHQIAGAVDELQGIMIEVDKETKEI